MLLSQLRLEGGGEEGRHRGGTVAMHYELMRDSTLEFLCEIKITEGPDMP